MLCTAVHDLRASCNDSTHGQTYGMIVRPPGLELILDGQPVDRTWRGEVEIRDRMWKRPKVHPAKMTGMAPFSHNLATRPGSGIRLSWCERR